MDKVDFYSVLLGVIAGRESACETRALIEDAFEGGAITIVEFRSLMGLVAAQEG